MGVVDEVWVDSAAGLAAARFWAAGLGAAGLGAGLPAACLARAAVPERWVVDVVAVVLEVAGGVFAAGTTGAG